MHNPDESRDSKAVFIHKKMQIDKALERLQKLSDDFFNVTIDEVHWGHVGDIESYAKLLKEITDKAFQEGEYSRFNNTK